MKDKIKENEGRDVLHRVNEGQNVRILMRNLFSRNFNSFY